MKTILLNILVTVAVVASCLLALEAFHTWQRVNAMWTWINTQAAAQQAAQQPPQQPSPKPEVKR